MQRETYKTLVAKQAAQVEEIFPWDLRDEFESGTMPLLLDIRCPDEFEHTHISSSINVPRGILEIAVDYGYEETIPELVEARDRRVVVICRSGNRSILAAYTLQQMGFANVASLQTGLRGWNDYEQPLIDNSGNELDLDLVDDIFLANVSRSQLGPDEIKTV
ncbi:MAG: rhodanese-like domain-containing protein [Gammaproteobacteria bacterium]|nr:rhodanese-like domain-containing protein [Gammaproteobacteria bacterium]